MCKCVVPAGMGYGCECCKTEKTKTTGVVFNPWPEQEYVFFDKLFARKEDVKPNEKSLIVTNRCRVA